MIIIILIILSNTVTNTTYLRACATLLTKTTVGRVSCCVLASGVDDINGREKGFSGLLWRGFKPTLP